MPRIYYKLQKLAGLPLKSDVIDLKTFDELFEQADQRLFEFSPPQATGFFQKLFGNHSPVFKFVQLSQDGISYNASEGNFYLPSALIFYDINDANFPSEFYFIAKLGQQLELRQCLAGEGIKWYQIADLHQAVNDPKIIKKIENSLLELKKNVAQSFAERASQTEPLNEQEEWLDLAPALKQAYIQLAKIALKNHPRLDFVIAYIEQMQNVDDGFFSTLGQLIDDLWEENIRLFVSMDWKQGVEDLQWHLTAILKENWNLDITLVDAIQHFGQDATVSDEDVFSTYNQALQTHGLNIGQIDTDSDSYVFLVHPLQDQALVRKNVEVLGYQYLNF